MTALGRFAGYAITLLTFAATAQAQSISFGLRGSGGFPTGSFSETSTGSSAAIVQGAKSGFGYGADVGVGLGPIGVYAGFDHISFDCQTTACGSDGDGSGIVKRNVLPWPGTLVTVSVPRMRSTRRRLIANPRPLPPNRREIEPSTWLNSWNSRGSASGGMPMPVSVTAIAILLPSAR